MTYIVTLQDKDIFGVPRNDSGNYSVRPTSKGFVIDTNGSICLLQVGDFYGLPGGGIEDGETPEQAFIRECKEEIGCDVHIEKKLGVALQVRDRTAKKYEIHYFVAKVVGEKGVPTTTQDDEKDVGFNWMPQGKVGSLLEEQIARIPMNESDLHTLSGGYALAFNARTHMQAFRML